MNNIQSMARLCSVAPLTACVGGIDSAAETPYLMRLLAGILKALLKNKSICQWILILCGFLFLESAFSAGFVGSASSIPPAEKLLRQSGLGYLKPAELLPDTQSSSLVARKMAVTAPDGNGPKVQGLIVRFRSPDAKLLSRQNSPPPQALIDEIIRLAGVTLYFQRAMSMDNFVFRFTTSVSWSEGQVFLELVKQSPQVESVELDTQVNHSFFPNDPNASSQWNLKSPTVYAGSANLGPAWDITQGSSTTVVAVLDTGVGPHSEFASRLLPGYDFVSDPSRSNDGDGRDGNAYDPGDWNDANGCGLGSSAEDSSWHGTHVTGIIAATGNNSVGIAGINWFTKIVPVRVLGKCGGTNSDILDGMLWAAGFGVPGAPLNANPARIINMSLGGTNPNGCRSSLYQEAINKIKSNGVLIVVAAGNDDAEAANFVPASCDGVMTVGAVDPGGYRASYSNFSRQYKVDISAPGGDQTRYGSNGGILSTVNSGRTVPVAGDLGYIQGTSMAAPHVTGIASLALAIDPLIAPELLFLAMAYTARSFPGDSVCTKEFPLCGSGIIDAYKTLQAVNVLKPYMLVYEFLNINLNHYFRTGNSSENAAVLNGSAGAGWTDTKNYFLAWRDGTSGAVPVCRFYGPGPNSHFYTANAAECADVKKDTGWQYEGFAFYVKLPINGNCPSGTLPIYRAYNNRFIFNDSNHRFTVDKSEVDALVANKWIYEGVAMCAAN